MNKEREALEKVVTWIKELFYQRCECCGKKKKMFYWTFELPPNKAYSHLTEVCVDCVISNNLK